MLHDISSTMLNKELVELVLGTFSAWTSFIHSAIIFHFISVLNDIASTMFNKKFIHEIFLKHTPLYSKKVLRAMFDRLAHASIMRLNAGSMDKVGKIISQLEK